MGKLGGGLVAAMSVVTGTVCLSAFAGAASGATQESSFKLSSPVLIGASMNLAGEDSVSINDYYDGIKMAIGQINRAGGIGGKQVQLVRKPLSVINLGTDPGQFLAMVQSKPTVIIGIEAVAGIAPLLSVINQSKIPVMAVTPVGNTNLYAGPRSSQYLWYPQAATQAITQAGVQYFAKDLKLNKIALMATNEAYGTGSVQASESAMTKLGLKPVVVRQHTPEATDLTSDILAVKDSGANAIMDWDYPNPLAVLLKQMPQNGLNVPVMSGASANIDVNNHLVDNSQIGKLYVSQQCDPAATKGTSSALKKFIVGYQKLYNATPSADSASAYDSVYITMAAVNKAKSNTPQKVNQALDGLSVTKNVVCAPSYKADGAHVFDHTVTISKFSNDGTDSQVKVISVPPIPKQG